MMREEIINIRSGRRALRKFGMVLVARMRWFATRLTLGMLFYLGITPICLLVRLFGKDFLELRYDKQASGSYWIPKEKGKDRNRYEKQF